MTPEIIVATASLVVSIIALGLSIHFWSRSFRPLVTAMVKTHKGNTEGIAYDLVVLNSGTIPARNITIRSTDSALLNAALAQGATEENKKMWLVCFDEQTEVEILHNNERVSCSFGKTKRDSRSSFWKAGAKFPIRITYTGWFGKKYHTNQMLQIADSDSFTGFMWG